jgi:hypothetical protein
MHKALFNDVAIAPLATKMRANGFPSPTIHDCRDAHYS